ncbi:hypothetical protein KI387_011329, partial [Taxus chinensis]
MGLPLVSLELQEALGKETLNLPSLFIIIVECLGRLARRACREKKIHGIQLARNNHPLFFRQFVDDSSMMGRATQQEAKRFQKVLHTISAATAMFRAKYAENNPPEKIIKSTLPTKGFSTLKFIKDGQPPLIHQFPQLIPIMEQMQELGWVKIAQYGKPTIQPWDNGKSWIPPVEWPIAMDHQLQLLLNNILKARLFISSPEPDKLGWGKEVSGTYSVVAGYASLVTENPHPLQFLFKHIWHLGMWPKVIFFLWLLIHRRVLTGDCLLKRGLYGPFRCALCLHDEESSTHLFFSCPWVTPLWQLLASLFKIARELVISPANPRLGLLPMTYREKVEVPNEMSTVDLIKNKWEDPKSVTAVMSVEVSELFTREVARYVDETEEEAKNALRSNRHILDRTGGLNYSSIQNSLAR